MSTAIHYDENEGLTTKLDSSDSILALGVQHDDASVPTWLRYETAKTIADNLWRYDAHGGTSKTILDGSLASEIPFNEAMFRLAAIHGKPVRFRYVKGVDKAPEERLLIPQSVQQVGDHLTFIGHDPDRDDVRAYRLDRVRGEVSFDA